MPVFPGEPHPMKRLTLLCCLALAGCGGDWRDKAVVEAEAAVRAQRGDPALVFTHVEVTGDSNSGQACGTFHKADAGANAYGGGGGDRDGTRFIYFVDGAGGQNPYIDDPAAPYPANKSDFALNWRSQCLELGYTG